MHTLSGPAPAKINLLLEVTGRRDDGYHEIDTVLQTLDLADHVTLSFGGGPPVAAHGPYAAGTPEDTSNLAWRAAAELAALTGHDAGTLAIALDKRIPAAGGLGGGASDAATTLRLLQDPWDAAEEQLLEAATRIGSDEAFFLLGGTARARGRGELVEPLPPLAEHGVVLFVPFETIQHKTARMFGALSRLPFDDGAVVATWVAARHRHISSASVFNAFERVAFDVFPGLSALWEALEARVGEPVRLAGAGPTLFWIGPLSRADLVAEAGEGLPCTIVRTRTAGSLWTP